MPDKTIHQRALDLVNENHLKEAADLLAEALGEKENAELWNDWATIKIALAETQEALAGYERALELEPKNAQVHFNLGVLLLSQGKTARGVYLLRQCKTYITPAEQDAVKSLLKQYKEANLAPASQQKSINQIDKPSAKVGKRVLVVHDVLPHTDHSASDVRLMQVIRRLMAGGHQVTYIGRNGANRDRYEAPLTKLGVKVFSNDAERLASLGIDVSQTWKFKKVVEKGAFEVAIFFHWYSSGISVTEHYLDDLRKLSPDTRIAVLTDHCHGMREWCMADLSHLSTDRERALDFLVREVACYRAADLVLAIAGDDRQCMLEMVPDLQIELLPMTADTHVSGVGFDDRHDFVFLANFDNLANRDATTWFCDEIWPRIRKRMPQAKLHVAGNNIPEELAKPEGIQILGHVADLESMLEKYRVFISPVRFGTDIKNENLTALGNGVPLITTTIGAEGMSLTDGENAIIEDSAGAFANKAIELHNNRELWQKLAINGRKHIEVEFSVARLDAQIAKTMEHLDAIVPQKFDPEHRFSVRVVEELHPEVLTAKPAESRNELRILGYVEMAEKLAGLGHPSEALAQIRHIFYHVRGPMPRSLFFARILTLMERCYREIDDLEASLRCGNEAILCMPELNPVLTQHAGKPKPQSKAASGPGQHALTTALDSSLEGVRP
jgi:glycosyltransferase involved in cell wall biosynthesis